MRPPPDINKWWCSNTKKEPWYANSVGLGIGGVVGHVELEGRSGHAHGHNLGADRHREVGKCRSAATLRGLANQLQIIERGVDDKLGTSIIADQQVLVVAQVLPAVQSADIARTRRIYQP